MRCNGRLVGRVDGFANPSVSAPLNLVVRHDLNKDIFIMMKVITLYILITMTNNTWAEDDPSTVLNEAKRLTDVGKNEEALNKFIWFYENSLRIQPAMAGVRLSFALSYWMDLGKKYPPALQKLEEYKKLDEEQVALGKSDRQTFLDVVALNRVLKAEADTISLFKILDEKFPVKAKELYSLAVEQLYGVAEFKIMGKYIKNPADRLIEMKRAYESNVSFEKNSPGAPRFSEQFLRKAFIIAFSVYSANNRNNDTRSIVDGTIDIISDKSLVEGWVKISNDQIDKAKDPK